MTDLKNRALQLVGHGLPAFLTTGYSKHPGAITPYLNERFEDIPALLDERADEATGLSLRCETLPEGLVILDCDWTEEKHFDEFAAMTQLDLSELTSVRTTSGGLHIYLQCPRPSQLPGKARVTFSDGTPGKLDVRARGIHQGIMFPGSQALNHAEEVGRYEALGEGTEDAIYNLQWSTISVEQQRHLESVLGAKPKPPGSEAEGDGQASGVFAKAIEPLLTHLEAGFDTNDLCTTLANICGMMLRTDGAPDFVALDCWKSLLSVAPERVRTQLEGHARHKKSFITMASGSIEKTQAATRAIIAEAKNPAVSSMDTAAEKEVYEFFGGAVGLKLDSQGAGTFGLLRDAGYAHLHEQDWDNPELVKVARESMFAGKSGLSWLESLLVELQMQGRAVSKTFDRSLREFLFESSTTDESAHLREVKQLREALENFCPGEWAERKASLSKSQTGRWLWHMAPVDTSDRRTVAFVALVDEKKYIAVPPGCVLTQETMGLLGTSVGKRAAKNGKYVHYFAIPEEVSGD